MANGHPSFGDGASVTLDIGQEGGVRAGAGQAKATIQVVNEPAEVATQVHHLPQQNGNVRDVLGFVGELVRWNVTLRTVALATYNAIRDELNGFKTGATRTGGLQTTFDPALVNTMKLTDFDGALIADRVVLRDWRTLSVRRFGNQQWAVIVKMQIDFEIIG